MLGQRGENRTGVQWRSEKIPAILQYKKITFGNFTSCADTINYKPIPSYWLENVLTLFEQYGIFCICSLRRSEWTSQSSFPHETSVVSLAPGFWRLNSRHMTGYGRRLSLITQVATIRGMLFAERFRGCALSRSESRGFSARERQGA